MSSEALYFITGNIHKFEELRAIVPNLAQVDIDLQEIQAVDSRDVIASKLSEARKHLSGGAILVEDTALHLACLNCFPGALIKWLLSSVGCQGIYDLCHRLGNHDAKACTVLGYLPEDSETPIYFDGILDGAICPPKGARGFGWDPIFIPSGFNKTLAEMEENELQVIKMRRRAAEKLVAYLAHDSEMNY